MTIVACSTQSYLPSEFPKNQLIFGSGGGFTGLTNTYILQENGQLFKQEMDDSYEELTTIPKKDCKILFKEYQNIEGDTLSLNSPGNRYQFLKLKKTDTTYAAVWGDGMVFPPDTVTALFQSLIELTEVKNDSLK